MAIRVLALALCLAVAARTTAKPPDLPQPTTANFKAETPTVDFVPLVEPLSALGYTEGEECEPTRAADLNSACRCMTRCWLFSVCPLFSLRDCLSVWMASGPFGSEMPCEEATPETLPNPPREEKSPEVLPNPPSDVTTCPYLKAKKAKAVHKKLSKKEVMRRVRSYVKAAKLFEELGFYSDACNCYATICRLAPHSRWAREAETRMEALYAAEYPGDATEAAEESEPPQSGLPAEPTQVFAAYDITDLVKENAGNKAPSTKEETKLAADLIWVMQ